MYRNEFEAYIDGCLKYHIAIKGEKVIKFVIENICKIDDFYFYIKKKNGKIDVEYISEAMFVIKDIIDNNINELNELSKRLIEENEEIKKKTLIDPEVDVLKNQIDIFSFV